MLIIVFRRSLLRWTRQGEVFQAGRELIPLNRVRPQRCFPTKALGVVQKLLPGCHPHLVLGGDDEGGQHIALETAECLETVEYRPVETQGGGPQVRDEEDGSRRDIPGEPGASGEAHRDSRLSVEGPAATPPGLLPGEELHLSGAGCSDGPEEIVGSGELRESREARKEIAAT
jgi:hypothetical protein